jgi:hypothetical protein
MEYLSSSLEINFSSDKLLLLISRPQEVLKENMLTQLQVQL